MAEEITSAELTHVRVLVDTVINDKKIRSGEVALLDKALADDLIADHQADDDVEAIDYALTIYPDIINAATPAP